MTQDELWMKIALEEAKTALSTDNVPIGAVIIKNDKLIAKAHNDTKGQNQLAHAEFLVIQKALRYDRFLYDYTLYVTLEPCTMCAGSIVLSRVGKVVFGAYDEKAGAVGSLYNILKDKRLNHSPIVIGGVLQNESSKLLKEFFQKKRKKG